jgi:hypothetical protein
MGAQEHRLPSYVSSGQRSVTCDLRSTYISTMDKSHTNVFDKKSIASLEA